MIDSLDRAGTSTHVQLSLYRPPTAETCPAQCKLHSAYRAGSGSSTVDQVLKSSRTPKSSASTLHFQCVMYVGGLLKAKYKTIKQ